MVLVVLSVLVNARDTIRILAPIEWIIKINTGIVPELLFVFSYGSGVFPLCHAKVKLAKEKKALKEKCEMQEQAAMDSLERMSIADVNIARMYSPLKIKGKNIVPRKQF